MIQQPRHLGDAQKVAPKKIAIQIDRVSKLFRIRNGFLFGNNPTKTIKALDQIDWIIEEGRVVALVGPNGAGKTTLLRILSSLVIPDEGSVSIRGYRLPEQSALARRVLGFAIGEDRSFYWRLTVRQNLEFFSALYNLPPQKSYPRIKEVCEILELNDVLDRRYEMLSTGNRQRVSLARSLLSDAFIILADEPTRSLDPLSKRHLQQLLRKLSREWGKTIFFTTHDLQEAETIADTIGILVNGRLQAQGSPALLKKELSSLAEVYAEYCQSESAYVYS